MFQRCHRGRRKLSTVLRETIWSNNLAILSLAKSEEERAFYLHLCQQERLTNRQLHRQIDAAVFERSMLGNPKLSPMLREIAPEATRVFRDQYVIEFLGGTEFPHGNVMKKALVDKMKQFILELGKVDCPTVPPRSSVGQWDTSRNLTII